MTVQGVRGSLRSGLEIPEAGSERVVSTAHAPAVPEHEPAFYILVNEEQATELSFGRVPALVQKMAKTMVDHTFEELKQHAAKPVRMPKRRHR